MVMIISTVLSLCRSSIALHRVHLMLETHRTWSGAAAFLHSVLLGGPRGRAW